MSRDMYGPARVSVCKWGDEAMKFMNHEMPRSGECSDHREGSHKEGQKSRSKERLCKKVRAASSWQGVVSGDTITICGTGGATNTWEITTDASTSEITAVGLRNSFQSS